MNADKEGFWSSKLPHQNVSGKLALTRGQCPFVSVSICVHPWLNISSVCIFPAQRFVLLRSTEVTAARQRSPTFRGGVTIRPLTQDRGGYRAPGANSERKTQDCELRDRPRNTRNTRKIDRRCWILDENSESNTARPSRFAPSAPRSGAKRAAKSSVQETWHFPVRISSRHQRFDSTLSE